MYSKVTSSICCLLFLTHSLLGVLTIPEIKGVETEAEVRYRGIYFGDFGLYEKNRMDTGADEWEHEFRGDLLFKKGRNLLEFRVGHRFQDEDALLDAPDDTIEQVRQAYFDFSLGALEGLNVRLGRQELSYNRGILLDENDWDMEGNYWDAVKFYWDGTDWDVDVLYGQLADEHDNDVAGINLKRTSERNTINEFYLWYFGAEEGNDRIKVSGSPGLEIYNFGARMEGKLSPELFYHWMVNYQAGEVESGGATSDIDAYHFLVNLDYFVDHRIIRNIGIEFTHSSGNDGDTDDMETFIPLYGDTHTRSGAMDWMSQMNAEILTLYLFADLHPKVHGLIEYHHFWVNSLDAGWYLGHLGPAWWGGTPRQNWPTPGAEAAGISKEVGSEVDLHFQFGNNPNREISFGYSIFFPGNLLQDWDWLKDDVSTWAYLQTDLKF